MNKLEAIINGIKDASKNGVLFENEILTGYSGHKFIGTLQRLAKQFTNKENCYLEVGVFQGLTLLSVAASLDKGVAYGIDNFAFFNPNGENLNIINERIQKLNINNALLINLDYEDALENLEKHIGSKKVSVYFIDGPHDYRSQLMCLELIKPYLANNAIIIIDDCNYRHVRQANRDFLFTHPEYKLIFESYTPAHPSNLKGSDLDIAKKGWWDGINIIYKDSNNEVPNRAYPPTYRNRNIYENEHLNHSSKYAENITDFLGLVRGMKSKNPILIGFYFFKNLFSRPKGIVGKYKSLNTYSDNLPNENFLV